jgi:hypothetical protein
MVLISITLFSCYTTVTQLKTNQHAQKRRQNALSEARFPLALSCNEREGLTRPGQLIESSVALVQKSAFRTRGEDDADFYTATLVLA